MTENQHADGFPWLVVFIQVSQPELTVWWTMFFAERCLKRNIFSTSRKCVPRFMAEKYVTYARQT